MSQIYLSIDKASDLNSEALSFLATLDKDYFPTPWSLEDWQQLFFTGSERYLLLVKENDRIEGFALFDVTIADSFAHLLKIIVNPNKRGQKIGKKLLSEAVDELSSRGIKSYFLEVEDHNAAAIKLYEAQGFKVIHQKKQFYSSGASALIMTLSV